MPSRPANILLIQADQLAWKGLGAYGNALVRTPNLDRLAAGGARFEFAYTPFPLCLPARASLWTSRLPHETGVESNGRDFPVPTVPETLPTLGQVFREAGYQTVHFGKTHDADSLRGCETVPLGRRVERAPAGFPYNDDTFHDFDTTEKCVEVLARPPGRPFLMVADLINPHNICGWVGENAGPEEKLPVPEPLPPLPENFEVADWGALPRPVQYACCAHRRLRQAAHWTPKKYRQYLAAYYHYTELLDTCVGRILEALHSTPAGRNTLVMFFADHGDGMAAHRMVTKHTVFYEETTRVPFIAAGPGLPRRRPGKPGIAGGGRRMEQPLVSLLDVFPTLCAYAGVAAPAGLRGMSLLPWLRGEAPATTREYVVSQWRTEWGFTIEPGRMIRTARYKYVRYVEDSGEELYDLSDDPGEMRNLARSREHADVLARHRELLQRCVAETGDPFFSLPFKADGRWRSHPPGYPHHIGSSAAEEGLKAWAARKG